MKQRTKIIFIGLALFALVGLLGLQFVVRQVEKALSPTRYALEVAQWAQAFEVPEGLVYAVIRTESGFDPKAQSDAGAIGLMQMTEETFVWLYEKLAPTQTLSFEDLYTPEQSIRLGTYYLSICLKRYGGDFKTAAAAYHSGIGTVDTLLQDAAYTSDGIALHTFPYPQMQHYVYKVEQSYDKYKKIWGVS